MKFIVLVYNDPGLVADLPPATYKSTMRECLSHADEMARSGKLLESQILEDTSRARSIRIRNGRRTVLDGPFAETKEVLGGFNIVEAADIDEAMKLAEQFPWAETGCLEIRPIRDMEMIRRDVAE
jgi:hypothetical protein